MSEKKTWLTVTVYAIAMAWVESAVVVYLRTLLDRIQPMQQNPLPNLGNFGLTEIVREGATMVMLMTVGFLAGTTIRKRIAYSLLAFGVWDIFYYIFLHIICGWPQSLTDWDILFLIPLPWWGPVIAPMLIAALMIVSGTIITQSPSEPSRISKISIGLCVIGSALALYVFMRDALKAFPLGEQAVRKTLPTRFSWEIFIPALALMSSPTVEIWNRCRASKRHSVTAGATLNVERMS